jgi:hypothetical protein
MAGIPTGRQFVTKTPDRRQALRESHPSRPQNYGTYVPQPPTSSIRALSGRGDMAPELSDRGGLHSSRSEASNQMSSWPWCKQKAPTGRQRQIRDRVWTPLREMFEVQWNKEVGILTQVLAAPQVPTRRITRSRVPHPIQWSNVASQVLGCAKLRPWIRPIGIDADASAYFILGVSGFHELPRVSQNPQTKCRHTGDRAAAFTDVHRSVLCGLRRIRG